jgi:DNA-binding NarL/FixJ family response regulator
MNLRPKCANQVARPLYPWRGIYRCQVFCYGSDMSQTTIKVAVVEDDPLHLERFRDNLSLDPGLHQAGEYSTVAEATAALATLQPDVLLVDLGLPDGSGFEVIEQVRQTSPATEIMVVSVFGGEANLMRALQAGATGYLLKDSLPADFNSSIRALKAGESPISPSLARLLLRRFQDAAERGAPLGRAAETLAESASTHASPALTTGLLSQREIAILECVARGISFADIAQQLFISPHTVKTHIKNIYRKLQAHSSTHAVHIARQHKLIAA